MHRDKADEVLESLESLLGILEQSEVEAESPIASVAFAFRVRRSVEVVNQDDRIQADVLRGALQYPDGLLGSSDQEDRFAGGRAGRHPACARLRSG